MLENIVTLICAMNSHLFNLVSGHTFPSSPTRYVTLFTSPLIKGGTMDRNTIKEVSNGSRVRECVLPVIFELESEPRLFEGDLREEGCRRGLGSCELCLPSQMSRLVVFGNPFSPLGLAGCAVCEERRE